MIYPTLTDDEVLQQVNECIDQGKVMSLSLMERGLRVQRDLLAKIEHKQLATGLEPLQKRQAVIFDFLVSFIDTNGYPPSIREIGEAVGISSSSTVHSHLERLEKKGYIKRNIKCGRPRSLQITGKREVGANALRRNRSGD